MLACLLAAPSGLVPGASLAHATWRVIWEDEALLVVDKDAGLLLAAAPTRRTVSFHGYRGKGTLRWSTCLIG